MPYFGVPSMTNKTNGREFFQDKVFTDIDASDGYPRTCKVRTLCGWGGDTCLIGTLVLR